MAQSTNLWARRIFCWKNNLFIFYQSILQNTDVTIWLFLHGTFTTYEREEYSADKTIFLSFINLTKYRCHNLAIPMNFPSRKSDRKMLEKLKTYPFTKKCLWSAIVYPGRAVAHRGLGLRAAENVGTVAGGFWPRWFWSHGCTDDRPSEKLIWPCLLLSRKFTVTHTHTQKPQSAFSK